MKRKLFDIHCHYLFDLSIEETIDVFKEEFEALGIEKMCFLSIPQEYNPNGTVKVIEKQNEKALMLKKAFAPNAYAFAGLVHPKDFSNKDEIKQDYLKQVKKYYEEGYDGMKMLEGYPTCIKYTKQHLDSEIYDEFYAFCEEKSFPIILHIANPDSAWDISKADKYAIEQGRVYDSSYPTKDEIFDGLFNVLKKYPKLTIILAHFGFFSEHYEDACKYMSYPNTYLDTTPGGEQFITIGKDLKTWLPFIEKYQDRIFYGTDFYAFPKDDWFEINYKRRTIFLEQFFETDTKHIYLYTEFKGINLDRNILNKIYSGNALRLLKEPKEIKE